MYIYLMLSAKVYCLYLGLNAVEGNKHNNNSNETLIFSIEWNVYRNMERDREKQDKKWK